MLDLEQFTSIVNLLNAGPCGKNCLLKTVSLNVIPKRIKCICKHKVKVKAVNCARDLPLDSPS
jgi:hypothetical protein